MNVQNQREAEYESRNCASRPKSTQQITVNEA